MKNNNNVAILSFLTEDFKPLQDITGPNKQEYCDKWGYQHIVKYAPYGSADNYYAFQRLRYIYDLFWGNLPEGKEAEVILCMNTHAQIMNHNIKVEDRLDDNHDFYISKDVNGLNAGVFIVRKSEWSKQWLKFLLDLEPIHKNFEWYEQSLMQQNWERSEFKDKIAVLDQRLINSYFWHHYNWGRDTPGQFQKGDWILHVPGKSTLIYARTLLESRMILFQSDEVKENIVK